LLFLRESAALAFPSQQFHRDGMLSAWFVDLANRAEVRLIVYGGGKRFALKALAGREMVFPIMGERTKKFSNSRRSTLTYLPVLLWA
jgi:hypothetical protein